MVQSLVHSLEKNNEYDISEKSLPIRYNGVFPEVLANVGKIERKEGYDAAMEI